MTLEEFSNQFDTLLNSHNIQAGYGEGSNKAGSTVLDEYEKSVYLTKAQEELVTSIYNGRNSSGDSFESTEEMRRYLSNLVMEDSPKAITNRSGMPLGTNDKHVFYTLPSDLWYITYESVALKEGVPCNASNPMDVYPVTQDDYNKTRRNPFRGANNRRALRLDLSDNVVEIISKYAIASYYVRYLRKPQPIILVDLPDGLTINNIAKQTECELHEALHQKILERAVAEALQSRMTTNNNK